ncbi:translocation/assembly module TamB domain-containing protein [Faecalibacter bovis]|uniref:Translocation and assembly module TamB C-terminal domain-containing protein n=1 Tax=Faecalibacter bovis TaxID=2898187 RepID=A0ABX7XBE8_9FLAO|nr:translocation/assembly module TamB [Faecalibacter bovis]QTV05215.1 hypothetical protein J9309_10570 [Faecalibacter bovis]
MEKLNKSLNTRMYVDSVDIDFFGKIYLNDISIKDDRDLDFITGRQLQTSLSVWSIISNPDYINLKEVKLVEPNIQVITYKGDSVSNFIKFVNGFSSDKPKDPTRIFKLDGDFFIKNGKVSIINQNSGNVWLKSHNLQLHILDFKLVGGDITGELANFCFEAERNGEKYSVKNFTGKVHYSDKEIRVDNLNMRTAESVLHGHLLMSYKQPSDMSDFNNKVFWDVFFDRGSVINFKDIRYFTNLFDKNNSVEVYGKVDGTLNNLNFKNFELKGGDNYIGANHLNLTDMMNGSLLKIKTNNLKANTSYQKLTSLLPTFVSTKIPVFIQRFGNMNYRGDLMLNPSTISIDGYAITALGDADVKAELINYKNPKSMLYSGTIDAKNLNIQQIADVKDLGYVSGKFKFNGAGTDIAKMKLDLDGGLRYIDLMGKRYNNITVDGEIKNNSFNGLFDIKDPNLNAQLNGRINFSGKPYDFDFTSKIREINLDFLGITKNMKAVVRGDVTGDFSLTNLNDLRGNIDLRNVYFRSKKDTISFDHITLNSVVDGNRKIMDLNVPNYMNATIDGKFKVTEVVNVINNSLVPLVPSFKQKKVSPGQQFNFDVYVEQNLLSYFDESIKIEPETRIQGFIDSDQNKLDVKLDTPGISYAGIELFQSKVNLNTLEETNNLNAKIDSLKVSGITIKDIDIRSIPKNDTLLVETDFKIGDLNPVDFNLNLYHTVSDKREYYIFGFSPSTITIDSTKWSINPKNDRQSNRMILNPVKKSFMVQDLVLESDDQHLDITGVFYEKENFNFNANFNQLHLDKIIPKALLGKLELEGIANGQVNVVRTKEKLEPTLQTTVSGLELNNFLLGDLSLNGGYNIEDNRFNFDLSLLRENIESVKANGDIINKPSGPELDIYANLDDFHVDFLEGFLGSVFSNMRGKMSGDVHIDGPLTLPNLNGDLVAKDLGMKVNFLGVDYLFEGENSLFVSKEGNRQGIIMLDDVKVKDTAFNTTGVVNGALLFRNISEWGLNLQFDADNLLVMNTTIKDNELFYGKIFAQGDVLMMGPVDQLGIYGNATIVGNSELTINTGSTTIESESNLVRFVPDQTVLVADKIENRIKGMTIDLSINAYPNAQVNLVFDAATNDKASARGTAENLRFLMNNTGLSLTGVYNIESGIYEFRQIPLIPKDFKVAKGSAVQFSGNPMDATLQIHAIYERSVSNVGDYLGIGFSQIYDTELSIDITETLAKPQIDFGLTLPNAGSDINSQLQSKFRSNQEEQMMQFSYILLTGKFGDALDITSGVTSTAADIGLSTIAGMLSSIINGVNIDLEYVGGSQQSGTNDKLRYSLSYQINERLRIRGAYGMAVRNQYVENFDGNLDLTYDVSKANNGSLVLNAFTKPTTFGIQQFTGNSMMNQSYGAGITYNASFDNFREFIGEKHQKKEAKAIIKANAEEVTPVKKDTIKENKPVSLNDSLSGHPVSKNKESNLNEEKPKKAGRGLVRMR